MRRWVSVAAGGIALFAVGCASPLGGIQGMPGPGVLASQPPEQRGVANPARSQPPGGAAARPLPSPPGVRMPEDAPVYTSYLKLQGLSAYRTRTTMTSEHPRMAQMQASGMSLSPVEGVVKPGIQQITMRLRLPASDLPGQLDDWEIRSVIKGSREVHRFSSSAAPRYLAQGEPAQGFFRWQCNELPARAGGSGPRGDARLTDLRDLGSQTVAGQPVHRYGFHVTEEGRVHGPLQLDVAEDGGLPVRLKLAEPDGPGRMTVDYYGFGQPAEIEVPPCL